MKTSVVCDCGSNEIRYPVKDGYGIFLFYGCDKCTKNKLRRFRVDTLRILETRTLASPRESR